MNNGEWCLVQLVASDVRIAFVQRILEEHVQRYEVEGNGMKVVRRRNWHEKG
jgi:hypothetical protein